MQTLEAPKMIGVAGLTSGMQISTLGLQLQLQKNRKFHPCEAMVIVDAPVASLQAAVSDEPNVSAGAAFPIVRLACIAPTLCHDWALCPLV